MCAIKWWLKVNDFMIFRNNEFFYDIIYLCLKDAMMMGVVADGRGNVASISKAIKTGFHNLMGKGIAPNAELIKTDCNSELGAFYLEISRQKQDRMKLTHTDLKERD